MRTIIITNTKPLQATDLDGADVPGVYRIRSCRRDPDPISVGLEGGTEWNPDLIAELEFFDGRLEDVYIRKRPAP